MSNILPKLRRRRAWGGLPLLTVVPSALRATGVCRGVPVGGPFWGFEVWNSNRICLGFKTYSTRLIIAESSEPSPHLSVPNSGPLTVKF